MKDYPSIQQSNDLRTLAELAKQVQAETQINETIAQTFHKPVQQTVNLSANDQIEQPKCVSSDIAPIPCVPDQVCLDNGCIEVDSTIAAIDQPVAVITGGSSGIGLTTAQVFSAHGYRVFELSRHGKNQPGIQHIHADVTSEVAVRAAFDHIWRVCGRIDVVISNAGFGIAGSIECTPIEKVKAQFDVNVFGAVIVAQVAIPYMRQSGGGRIGFTSSVAAVTPIPFQAFYTCTKASINALVLGLNNELKPFNIQAFALMPGDICTGFTAHRESCARADESDIYGSVVQRSIEKMEKDELNGGSPMPLARKIYQCSTQKRTPKPIQGFGFVYRLLLVLAKFLPVRFMNWILFKLYAS